MSAAHDWEGTAGDHWAAEWRRTDRSFGGLTDRLLSGTRGVDASQVLDIGCGAGELSLAVARGRSGAQIVGIDISPQLVATAQERAANHGNIRFELGDASRWHPSDDFAPDLLISRHGVMFFDDPTSAFANLAELAAPDATLLFSCFRGPAENEIFTGIGGLLPPPDSPPDPEAPGPMAFADPDRVHAILSQGGWTDIRIEPFDFAMVVGMGEDPVSDAVEYFCKIGPLSVALEGMDDPSKANLIAELRAYLAPREVDGLIALGAAAWIVTAKRA